MDEELSEAFALHGRVAVVTGAGSGIGRETALVLARAGAIVALCDLDGAALALVAAEIEALGGAAMHRRVDVSRRAEIDALATAVEATHGRIDIWVNVAGLVIHTPVLDVTEEEMDRQVAVNQKGVFWGCVAAARAMRKRRYGSIVNISSTGADTPPPGGSVYAMTKAAVNVCTRACAMEFGPLGIRVNAIGPGFIYTPMTRAAKEPNTARREEMLRAIAAAMPLGIIGTPRDIALAVLYLASDASRFMTGQVLRPNGGAAMP